MKPLSAETIQDLIELLRSETLWERLQGREGLLLSTISRIRQRMEPQAIQYLALVAAFDARQSLRSGALSAMNALLCPRTPREVVQLADGFRNLDWQIAGKRCEDWYSLKPTAVDRWSSYGADAEPLFAVASSHGSGFVREAAVRRLSTARAAYVIPILRVRLNDWVEEVRVVAFQTIMPHLQVEDLRSLLPFMPVIADLRRCGRGQHERLLERLYARFRTNEARALLVEGCRHQIKEVRWWCFQMRCNLEQAETLWLEILHHGDIAMRRSVAASVLAEAGRHDPSPYLDLMLRDRFMSVRRDGLLALVSSRGAEALERLKPLMADANATMREFARFYVRKWSNPTSIVEYYRTLLASGSLGDRLAGCIAGLGEAGDVTDVERLLSLLSHRRARIRRVTLLALDRLLPLEDIGVFMASLKDPSPRVRQIASAALGRRSKELSADDLLTRFSQAGKHEQEGLRRAINHLGNLVQLGVYLVISQKSDLFRDLAVRQVENICRRTVSGYIHLESNAPALRRIETALQGIDPVLATKVTDFIRALTGRSTWPTR